MHPETRSDIFTITRWMKETVDADPIMQELEETITPVIRHEKTYTSIYSSFGSCITIHLWQLPEWKAAIPFRKALAHKGWKLDTTNGNPSDRIIKWVLRRENKDNEKVSITVTGHLAEDAQAECAEVTIGKKMVEIPIKKVLCGKELEDWRNAQQASGQGGEHE